MKKNCWWVNERRKNNNVYASNEQTLHIHDAL